MNVTKPLRLAVIFDQRIEVGGGYQQALTSALGAQDLPVDLATLIYFTTVRENVHALEAYHIKATLINLSYLSRLWMKLRNKVTSSRLLRWIKNLEQHPKLERILIDHQIDLVYFLSPSSLAESLETLNYILTLWDLCHRDDPEFPEVRWEREFEKRQAKYSSILPRATAIFVDSERGKINAMRRYCIDEERIHVVPFQASVEIRIQTEDNLGAQLDIKKKYSLDFPYVFYPAQFWAHKNHIYILEGLLELEERYGIRLCAIFSGRDKGNQAHIENFVRNSSIKDRVRFPGFVDSQELEQLYRQSIALVMPTYFGPTNLPPIEAFKLGVPVLYSDKEGLREQVLDAALLVDLKDPGSLAAQLNELITDKSLRKSLVERGLTRAIEIDSTSGVDILRRVLEDFRCRRRCWS